MSSTDRNNPRIKERNASPLAVLGAIGLVMLAIGFGVLGPQIRDRGNIISGIMLTDVLEDSAGLFVRGSQRVLYSREHERVSTSEMQGTLVDRYGDEIDFVDLLPERFAPALIESEVGFEGMNQSGIAVGYAEDDAFRGSGETAMLLYLGETTPLVARDAFGVPASMIEGHVYLKSTRTATGVPVWSAAWHEGSLIRILFATDEDTLFELLESMGISDQESGKSDSMALFAGNPGLDEAYVPSTLSRAEVSIWS